jgi:UDP-N-acetylglucosamine--N-acetylmuramyl-(pentapeptide) pyrophosphoryl-undecaprenol N-acetylglucosamine transferase
MSERSGVRILIATGGTAGHVVPALAVAEQLRSRGAEVFFVGGDRAEATLVPQAGFPLRRISVEGLSRTHPLRAARALLRAGAAVVTARRTIAKLRPDAVMGGGGYVAGPVGLAALSAGAPLVLTEADSRLGLSNRLLARGARRVCLAFPPEGKRRAEGRGARAIANGRWVVAGRPAFPVCADRERARARFGVAPGERCVLVFGGSLGARSLNLAAVEGLPALLEDRGRGGSGGAARGGAAGGMSEAAGGAGLRVLHIGGRRDHPELAARELPGRAARYQLIEYLDLADFDVALAAADLVVARSGGSVFEIAAHGLPAILVPYPHAAGDHQSANARWMASAGAAVVIPDAELTAERLREQVRALLSDEGRLAAMAAASRGLARPRAAAEVAEALLEAAAR